jgi:hypothetical protein
MRCLDQGYAILRKGAGFIKLMKTTQVGEFQKFQLLHLEVPSLTEKLRLGNSISKTRKAVAADIARDRVHSCYLSSVDTRILTIGSCARPRTQHGGESDRRSSGDRVLHRTVLKLSSPTLGKAQLTLQSAAVGSGPLYRAVPRAECTGKYRPRVLEPTTIKGRTVEYVFPRMQGLGGPLVTIVTY